MRQSTRARAVGPRAALRAFVTLAALSLTAVAGPAVASAGAQRLTRPELSWVTFETAHFRFHAPRDLAGWTRAVAERMEAVRGAEQRVVGTVPGGVTEVVVDDPYNVANGSAYPFLDGPAIFLWPVPPDPRSTIGNARGWGELLAVHEFAHIAHLTRPSRNWRQRLLRTFIPGRIGPVTTRSPRWVIEGYATYVEGTLTGSGRPHAAIRSAVLRRWALDGALPSYGAVSGGGGFYGGSFAYLMGSAYLEWLGATRGDSSVTAVWRRMTARADRPFDAAFAGVYGDGPATLYNHFVADVTVSAFGARAQLDSAGRVDGTLVQHLARSTGDPAVSPDGRRMAVELASSVGPSRIAVVRLGADAARDTAADAALARAKRRLLQRDPEDVPAIQKYPLARPSVATLLAANGTPHHDPRWFADGRRVLVWRSELTHDDVLRPDVYVWDTGTGALRRITREASVQDGDPSPDGQSAVATRCAGGHCDLVRVDLATGAVSTLVAGTFARTWTRPRWSPDGRRVVAPVQEGDAWRIAIVDAATGAFHLVTPADGAERYDAAFAPDGSALVYTSERGGVPNVVSLPLGPDGAAAGPERALTRVAGAAFAAAPDAAERSVYFLDLTSHGLDLRRVVPDSMPVRGGVVDLTGPAVLLPRTPQDAVRSAIAPRPTVAVDTFATTPLRAHPYGIGPRHYVVLPLGNATPDGGTLGLQLASTDPVGRLTWLLQGLSGDPRTWKGGALRATWRGLRPTITGEVFGTDQRLGAGSSLAGFTPAAPALAARTRFDGAALFAGAERWLVSGVRGAGDALASPDTGRRLRPTLGPVGGAPDVRVAGRLGVVAGRFHQDAVTETGAYALGGSVAPAVASSRSLALAEGSVSLRSGRGDGGLLAALGASGATGHTAGAAWRRGGATATLGAYSPAGVLRVDGAYVVAGRASPVYERPTVGGPAPELFDAAVLSQRLVLAALPTAFRAGRQAALARLSYTAGALVPYAALVAAGDDRLGDRARLAGVELRQPTPFAPFARVPASRLVAGVARIFDRPLEGRTRGYLSVAFLP